MVHRKLEFCTKGPDASEPITSMAMEGKAVWVAAGSDVIKYLRGKEVRASLLLSFFSGP